MAETLPRKANTVPPIPVGQASETLTLLSSVPGRARWQTNTLQGQPRRAAAVQVALRGHPGVTGASASPITGRVLVLWDAAHLAFQSRAAVERALYAKILSEEATALVWKEIKRDTKASRLVGKLIIGGAKLGMTLFSRIIWGAMAASPLVGPISALGLAATVITGYEFLRAFWRTITGQSGITTGTLIGAATLSSIALRENVTALIVLWLLNLGEYLEMLTLRRTRRAIRNLLATDEDEIWLLIDGKEVAVTGGAVHPGNLVAVYAGRKIAVDGEVVSGSGTVNEAPITGESMPVVRKVGDMVFAGSILLAGKLEVRVSSVGDETVVGRLIQRVEQAHSLRPQIQKVGDSFAKKVVPSSFAAAIIVLVVTRDPRRALTMLLVACPCAAGLATPTAVSASIGNSARRGILIKGGTHLEAMAGIDTVCFDKTGTLTASQPTVQRVLPWGQGVSEQDVLLVAARAERGSQHPLALAILERAAHPITGFPADDEVEIVAGRGVRCWNGQSEAMAGNHGLLEQFGIDIPEALANHALACSAQAETVVFVVRDRALIGLVGIYAPVRTQAKEAISQLRSAGVQHLVMLTGDTEPVAAAVASQVGIDEWLARLLPQAKFDSIQNLRNQGRKVAMVGDGINDAPALALADVGIAMGTAGSDVAIETADIALAADDLRNVATTLKISRHTMRVIRQNYALALGTNSLGLYLAAVGSINPIIAAVLHNLSTILVISNSSRLIGFDPFAVGSGFEAEKHDAPQQPGDTERGTGKKRNLKQQAA